jgi:hypothetical protein
MTNVIDKVQKLLRLSRSSNVHEAAAAAAAADRLIQEHGLQEAQLEADGAAPAETAAEDDSPLTSWTRLPTWKKLLTSGLVRHYACAGFLTWGLGPQAYVYKVIGRPSDVANVRYMLGWLTVEIERLASLNKGQGKAYLDSYKRGAVNGVLGKLTESKQAQRAEAAAREAVVSAIRPEATSALAIYDRRKDEALEKMYALHPEVEAAVKRQRGGSSYSGPSRYDAYSHGRREGRNIHVGSALGSGSTKGVLR